VAVLGWLVFGFAVGMLVRVLIAGRDPLGLIGVTTLGMAGALLGGGIGVAAGWFKIDDSSGFAAAVLGATTVLFTYRLLRWR
jgi:uncharacterized membrane protein YeaQ/YmgE (transglycosylase-associated protein family)